MACEHPKINWVGMSDGIHCGLCGQLIDFSKKPEPVKGPEPVKAEPEPKKAEPKKAAPKKAAPKKGGAKSGKSK